MSDLIERLQRLSMGLANEDEDTVLDAIAALKAQEWRRVEDELPPKGSNVLLGTQKEVFAWYIDLETEVDLPSMVTRWKPLPTPPAKETT